MNGKIARKNLHEKLISPLYIGIDNPQISTP